MTNFQVVVISWTDNPTPQTVGPGLVYTNPGTGASDRGGKSSPCKPGGPSVSHAHKLVFTTAGERNGFRFPR
jgi:hypothetical protein